MSAAEDYDDNDDAQPTPSRFGAFLKTLKTHDSKGRPIADRWQHYEADDSNVVPLRLNSAPPSGRPAGKAIELAQWRLDLITEGDPPAQRFLLEPLFPLGTAGVLFGPGGVGKSLVALDLCLAVARAATMPPGGLSFVVGPLGCNVPPAAGGAAIFLTLEDSTPEIHRRTVALDPDGSRKGAPVFCITGVDLPDFDPTLVEEKGRTGVLTQFAESGLPRLLDSVADACEYPPRLLVLDPAGDFLAGEENSAAVVKPLMRRLRELAREYDCTILLIGHVSKTLDPASPTMRGSNAWIANSRFAYSLSPPVPAKGARATQSDVGGSNLVWGELVKANHAGAPIGRRRPFQRDAATGRLLDASGLVAASQPTEADLLHALIMACIQAADAAGAFKLTGVCGLYRRREELPSPLSTMSRDPLEALGRKAIDDGMLTKDADGNLREPAD